MGKESSMWLRKSCIVSQHHTHHFFFTAFCRVGEGETENSCHHQDCGKHPICELIWGGDRPFVCSWYYCGKRFTRSDELQVKLIFSMTINSKLISFNAATSTNTHWREALSMSGMWQTLHAKWSLIETHKNAFKTARGKSKMKKSYCGYIVILFPFIVFSMGKQKPR